MEEVELARGEPNLIAAQPNLARPPVDPEVTERERAGRRFDSRPARRRTARTRATTSRGENGLVM